MKIQPVGFKWTEVDVVDAETGEARRAMAMVPHERFRFVCRRQFNPGDDYSLVPHEDRSTRSHGFFFACVNEAFVNLPEQIAARFPSADHLRYWALIECGFCDEKEFGADEEFPLNKKQALMLATFIRTEDTYARVSIHEVRKGKWKVLVRKAKSQSYAAMNKEAFEQSKRAVLELLENMTSVPRGTYRKETGRHA